MTMDYEALSCKNNPFAGLSPAEIDRLIIYLSYVRDPVITQKEIHARWHVRMSNGDIPIFEATRIADQIRYEIKRESDSILKARNRLIAIGCVLVLLLVVVEACRIPKQMAISNSAQMAKRANEDATASREELASTKEVCRERVERAERSAKEEIDKIKGTCSERIAYVERSAKEKIDETVRSAEQRVGQAEQKANERYRKALSDYISAGQMGDARVALSRIKDAIGVMREKPRYQIDGDLSQLFVKAKSGLKDGNCSAEVLFQCGESIKNYLIRHLKIEDAERLDVTDLMINCYKKSLALGVGKAGYELFMLYGGKKYCLDGMYEHKSGLKLESRLVVAENLKLAWTALENACSLGNYESLSVMLFLAQYKDRRYGIYFREPERVYPRCKDNDERFLVMLADHVNVTPDQLERIARVHLEFGHEYSSYAVEIFRRASARGNLSTKRWLITNGHAFDK